MQAYTGLYPYAFMSYSHKDGDKIVPLVQKLQKIGCNIWFDEGILPADEWAETIAQKLANASLFFLILSKNSVASQNVKREIYYAVSKDIPILTYYLEDINLPEGIALQLGVSQAIHATQNTQTDCDAIKDVFPQNLTVKEPKIIWRTSNFVYAFSEEYGENQYAIIQVNTETKERKILFRHVDSRAFLSCYSCESIHFSSHDEFNPNNKDTLYFSVYSDLDHDIGVPTSDLYIQVDFSITDLNSENPVLRVLGGRKKRKQDAFTEVEDFCDLDSVYWVKNEEIL